jgi:hypothetical protein
VKGCLAGVIHRGRSYASTGILSELGPVERFVIIGNGPAGRAVAEELAAAGAGEVVLIGREHPVPFSRPGLIYLALGAMRVADLELPIPLGVQAVKGEAVAWSPEGRWVELADGRREAFTQVIWAVGARARKFPGAVDPAFPVFSLQTLGDGQTLSPLYPRRWGVVGGGLVGAEMAEWGVARGAETHWWVREPRLWADRLSEAESAALAARVRGFGVNLHLGTSVGALGKPVATSSGTFEVDAVGVAIGVEPVPVPGGAAGAHVVGDAAGRGAGSWSEAVREGRDLGRQLAGQPALERPSYRDDRSRCFDRSVTVLSARPPAHEVEAVDARTCRSIRLGFDEQGRWVQVVAMGWKLRADRIGRAFEAGLERRDLVQMRPFFNEPEGTRLPEKEWLQLLGIHPQ